jgi:hypothetical protein
MWNELDDNRQPIYHVDEYHNVDYFYNFPGFTNVFNNGKEKNILILSDMYNGMHFSEDYLVIPAVLNSGADRVSFENGISINSSDYAQRKEKGDFSLKDMHGYGVVRDEYGNPAIFYESKKNNRTGKWETVRHKLYKRINLYGDGIRAVENNINLTPSVIDNGSYKVEQEWNDADIIKTYEDSKKVKKEPLPIGQAKVGENEPKLAMTNPHIAQIIKGEKTITNRTAQFPDGVYTLPNGTKLNLSIIDKYTVIGDEVVGETPGTPVYSKDDFAKAEGYKDWADFEINQEFSENFIHNGQPRYVYNVEAIAPETSEIGNPTEVVNSEKDVSLQDNKQAKLLLKEIAELERQIEVIIETSEARSESSPEVIVANNIPKITPESARKETGGKTGNGKDIPTSMLSARGVTVDQAAHDIWENEFGLEGSLDTSEIKEIIIEVLKSGSVRNFKNKYNGVTELKELRSSLKEKNKQLKDALKGNPNQIDMFEEANWQEEEDEDENECDVPF